GAAPSTTGSADTNRTEMHRADPQCPPATSFKAAPGYRTVPASLKAAPGYRTVLDSKTELSLERRTERLRRPERRFERRAPRPPHRAVAVPSRHHCHAAPRRGVSAACTPFGPR